MPPWRKIPVFRTTGKPTFAVAVSAGMSNLALSDSSWPAFAIGTYEYVATVLTGVASITITPTAAGVITVNGNRCDRTGFLGYSVGRSSNQELQTKRLKSTQLELLGQHKLIKCIWEGFPLYILRIMKNTLYTNYVTNKTWNGCNISLKNRKIWN